MAIKFNTYNGDSSENRSNRSLQGYNIIMDYTLNTESTWINCNYPEHITSKSMLGDSDLGNKCIFTGTVKAGTVQVFYSHFNEIGEDLNYGIQIFNPNKERVTITAQNCAHDSGDWYNVCALSWKRFFTGISDCDAPVNSNGEIGLDPSTFTWLFKKNIAKGYPPLGTAFSGNFRFHTTKPVIVTVYAYKDYWKINGSATMYPYSKTLPKNSQYSGSSDGFFFSSKKLTFNAKDLKNKNGIYFTTHDKTAARINGTLKSDLIPIRLLGSNNNLIASPTASSPLENLGNWCAQYNIPIRLYNDDTEPVIFRGYFRTPAHTTDPNKAQSIICVLSSGWNNVTYGVADSYKFNTWNWLTVPLGPGEVLDDSYQFILGTNSIRTVQNMWTVEYKK